MMRRSVCASQFGKSRRQIPGVRATCDFQDFLFVCFLLFAVVCPWLGAQDQSNDERILAYDSQITVHDDGSMVVIETIKVRALGQKIVHGIYRDFPTHYKDRSR